MHVFKSKNLCSIVKKIQKSQRAGPARPPGPEDRRPRFLN
jgi:hypothetical protein